MAYTIAVLENCNPKYWLTELVVAVKSEAFEDLCDPEETKVEEKPWLRRLTAESDR